MATVSFMNYAVAIKHSIKAFELDEAKINSEALYQEGILAIREWNEADNHNSLDERQINEIPLCVSLELIEVLSSDIIQFEDDLKFSISKTCNLFMQFALEKAIRAERKLYTNTQNKISSTCDEILKTLPPKEVKTLVAINSCKQAILAWSQIQEGIAGPILKIARESLNVAKTASEPTVIPINAVLELCKFVEVQRKKIGKKWFPEAHYITLAGCVAKTEWDVAQIYRRYNECKKNINIQVCLIEAIAQIIQTNVDNKWTIKLITSEDKATPGLAYFAKRGNDWLKNIKQINADAKLTSEEKKKNSILFHTEASNCRVRFCALQALFEVLEHPQTKLKGKNYCIQLLALQHAHEYQPYFLSFLKKKMKTLSTEQRELWMEHYKEKNLQSEIKENLGKVKYLAAYKLKQKEKMIKKGKKSSLQAAASSRVELNEEDFQKFAREEQQLTFLQEALEERQRSIVDAELTHE